MKLVSLGLILCSFVSAQTDKKRTYGILFDNTGSMNIQTPRQKEIAKEILKQVSKQGTISVFGFATDESNGSPVARIVTGVECGNDIALIEKQIDGFSEAFGQTALFDAVRSAAERLSKPISTTCSRSAEPFLILMTDGEDRASATKQDELIKILKAIGVKIYVVGLLDAMSSDAGFVSTLKKSKEFLEKVTAETDGTLVIPKKRQSAEELRNYYLMEAQSRQSSKICVELSDTLEIGRCARRSFDMILYRGR